MAPRQDASTTAPAAPPNEAVLILRSDMEFPFARTLNRVRRTRLGSDGTAGSRSDDFRLGWWCTTQRFAFANAMTAQTKIAQCRQPPPKSKTQRPQITSGCFAVAG